MLVAYVHACSHLTLATCPSTSYHLRFFLPPLPLCLLAVGAPLGPAPTPGACLMLAGAAGFLVRPGCRGTSCATFSNSTFPAKQGCRHSAWIKSSGALGAQRRRGVRDGTSGLTSEPSSLRRLTRARPLNVKSRGWPLVGCNTAALSATGRGRRQRMCAARPAGAPRGPPSVSSLCCSSRQSPGALGPHTLHTQVITSKLSQARAGAYSTPGDTQSSGYLWPWRFCAQRQPCASN